jgi:CheY-like chemotaxis protein
MEAEILERIFEPYFTTKRVGEGTGMGLAMVHGIVKSHKGETTVYSEPGRGTIFHIFLPVLSKDMVVWPEIAKKELVRGESERILFVDNELALAEIGKKMLENLGYHVVSRTSSIEALAYFRERPDNFDIVITDMTMPKMTGVQLAKEIHNIRPDIPVILCTGFSESINEENYKSLGINAFVMKPILQKDIAKVIRDVLECK